MRRILPVALPVTLLTGCVAPSVRAPVPVQPPAPVTVAPPPVVAPPPSFDAGVEPGSWTYGPEANGSIARFGVTPQASTLAIRCDRSTRGISILVARSGQPTSSAMTLRATSTVKGFAAESAGTFAVSRINARDAILDALAFSRGRFSVAVDGVERAYPAWPEFTRVVEDCRA